MPPTVFFRHVKGRATRALVIGVGHLIDACRSLSTLGCARDLALLGIDELTAGNLEPEIVVVDIRGISYEPDYGID